MRIVAYLKPDEYDPSIVAIMLEHDGKYWVISMDIEDLEDDLDAGEWITYDDRETAMERLRRYGEVIELDPDNLPG